MRDGRYMPEIPSKSKVFSTSCPRGECRLRGAFQQVRSRETRAIFRLGTKVPGQRASTTGALTLPKRSTALTATASGAAPRSTLLAPAGTTLAIFHWLP